MDERIFGPLQLGSSGVAQGSFTDIPHAARAYASSQVDASLKLHRIPRFLIATGTLFSDCIDLIRLSQAVYGGSILSSSSRRALRTIRFPPEGYALGGRVSYECFGGSRRDFAVEVGPYGGFKAVLMHVVEEDALTGVALNNTNMSQDRLIELVRCMLHAAYRAANER